MLYLDHAATSWPKPAAVVEAVVRWFTDLGVSAERGDGDRVHEVADRVAAARAGIATRCGCPPERVAFTSGATESLNLALRGLLRPGDRVVTTALEHSSVARPLRALAEERGIAVARLDPDSGGAFDEAQLVAALTAAPAALLVFSHASNVTGTVIDAARWCDLAREAGVPTLVDASQTAGWLPLPPADLLALSAHKALHAPPGLGALVVRGTVVPATVKHGGTGSSTALDRHPEEWPARLEAGTPNTPAILGLAAALEWHADRAPTPLDGWLGLEPLRRALLDRPEVTLLGPPADRGLDAPSLAARALPILALTVDDHDPAEVGALLAAAGIHVRTGFCCAPWIHAALGTTSGGVVRLSVGPDPDPAAVLRVAEVLARGSSG